MKKKELLLLLLILVVGFLVRLYKFTNPIADWHSWRQVDTSAVSRSFAMDGFDVLHPRFHDISNVPSGMDNPEGYRFVEFPIYNVAQAGFYTIFNIFTIEQWGRVVTIFASLATSVFIFLLVRRRTDFITAFFSCFFSLLLPFNVFYGRTILPDPSMTAAIVGGIYFFDKWIGSDKKTDYVSFLLALLFTASAFLLKPYALFFTLPMLFIAWEQYGVQMVLKKRLWIFAIVSTIPLILWRLWIQQYPEGIPVSAWLFNQGNIRFSGAFFYWIFAERIGKLILGYWGASVFVLGILSNAQLVKKSAYFFSSFLLSSLFYISVIARGNVQHDYYQIAIMPSLCIFLGLGASFLFSKSAVFKNVLLPRIVLFGIISFMFFASWYNIRDFYNINNTAIIRTGAAIDKLVSKDALLVAPYNGDTTLLYHMKRKGWSSFQNPLHELIEKGADYLVLINPTEQDREIGETYQIISETPDYLLFDLHKSP